MPNGSSFQRRTTIRMAIAWSALLVLTACTSGAGTATSTDPVSTVLVTLASAQLTVGSQTQASAEARDEKGTVVVGQTASWASSDPSVATVSTRGVVSAMKAGTASILGTIGNVSGAANLTVSTAAPPPATQLAVMQQPSSTAQSGVAFGQQPTVALKDANGSVVSQSGIVVTAATASGGGVLSGSLTASTNASGVATFNNLAISGSGAHTLRFSANGLTSVISSTITISVPPPVASKLAITKQPGATAMSAVALSPQPIVQLQDASGNAVGQSGVQINAAIASGGGTLGGTLSATSNASGAASFTNLAITGTGAQTIQFTATGLTSATSSTITVTSASTATKLAITVQPGATATSGAPLSPQPTIQLEDANGVAISQSGVAVSAAVISGGGTLSGITSVSTNATGTAAFSNLAITGSGAQSLQFTAAALTSVTANSITVAASGTGGTVLFSENFEDTNWAGRGWYDIGGMTSLSSTDHIAGSGHSLQVNFAQGALKPSPNVNVRHLFPASDAVYVRYWIKHSTNWVGSGHNYHPHEFYLLSTLDDQYAGPSFNYLTTYIEDNWMSDGGHPLLQSQDAQNIDTTRINQDLTAITEHRAVSGCNGNPDNTSEISCYQSDTWNNVKVWRSALPSFVDATGPKYKGDWHKVEVYYRLNSIVSGIAQRDGVAQYWVDGVLYVDRHDLEFRTGAHPTLQFNQFIIAPYIGDGSPVAQTLWYDDLVVMTAPPGA